MRALNLDGFLILIAPDLTRIDVRKYHYFLNLSVTLPTYRRIGQLDFKLETARF